MGFACSDTHSVCLPICGDGLVLGAETCDDDDLDSGDGCSSTCIIETGFYCAPSSPSSCSSICGDGIIASDEDCDDTNIISLDGCSQTC